MHSLLDTLYTQLLLPFNHGSNTVCSAIPSALSCNSGLKVTGFGHMGVPITQKLLTAYTLAYLVIPPQYFTITTAHPWEVSCGALLVIKLPG